VGLWGKTGAGGLSWGQQGAVGGVVGRRLRQSSWRGGSVECTTHSGERVRTTLRNSVSWFVDCRCGLLLAWVALSEVVVSV
jgi:hypothetical protein